MNPIRFKATVTDPATGAPAGTGAAQPPAAPLNVDQAKELQSKLQDALQEAYHAEDQYGLYEGVSEKASMELQIARLKTSLALVTNYIDTGIWDPSLGQGAPGAGTPAAGTSPADTMEIRNEWKSGWNGNFITATDSSDSQAFTDGTYMGSVYEQAPGDPSQPTQIGFKLDENAVNLKVYNHGQDLIIKQTLADGKIQYWVGKNWVTKIDIRLAFDASAVKKNKDHPLKMDFSGAYRIGNSGANFSKEPPIGFLIRGSQGNDVITGSQNGDKIFGGAGDDVIDGRGGDDFIFGDDTLANPLTHKAALVFGESIGNDVILGGDGNDYIDGSGGINTGFNSDSGETNASHNIQKSVSRQVGNPFNSSWMSGSSGWQASQSSQMNGEVTLERSGSGFSTLNLTMPPDFDMVTAAQDGDTGVTLTFVGKDASGAPITQKVHLRDFLSQPPVKLVINGNDKDNIIDLHRITNNNQTNIIEIHGGKGDDMLFGAQNALTRDGLDPHTMFTTSGSVTSDLVNPADETTHVEVKNNRVEVSGANDFDIVAPAGYDEAYYIRGNNHDVYVVLVHPAAGGAPAERKVIHVVNAADNFVPTIHRATETHTTPAPGADPAGSIPDSGLPIDPIFLPGTLEDFRQNGLNLLDGGLGADTIFGSTADVVRADGSDNVMQGNYAAPPTPPPSGGTGGTDGSGHA